MLSRVCLSLALFVVLPAWSQVAPSATGEPGAQDDETRMRTPPPVSRDSYPTLTLSEIRTNYLHLTFATTTSLDDNVRPGSDTKPINDFIYTLSPSVAFDKVTPRLHQTWTFSPGFTLYQRTSGLNAGDQTGSLNIAYRLAPYVTLDGAESFSRTSNVFDQINTGIGSMTAGRVRGSPQFSSAGLVLPIGSQLSNKANTRLSVQLSRDAMIGADGVSTLRNYTDPSQTRGLATSNSSRGGSAFYNLRLTSAQYTGATYQYSHMVSSSAGGNSTTQTHTIYFFYTLYLAKAVSLSISGGPQHFEAAMAPFPASGSWTPALTVSMGWQKEHANFAAKYSRIVSGAGGLVGTFYSNNADANVRWKTGRQWAIDSTVNYAIQRNVSLFQGPSSPGGHSVSADISLEHSLGEHLSATIKYERLHQSYNTVAAIVGAPDSNREQITITYQFSRPLGR